MSAPFVICQIDGGLRHGQRWFAECAGAAAVTVADLDRRIALCVPCAQWLAGVAPDVEQTPIGASA